MVYKTRIFTTVIKRFLTCDIFNTLNLINLIVIFGNLSTVKGSDCDIVTSKLYDRP